MVDEYFQEFFQANFVDDFRFRTAAEWRHRHFTDALLLALKAGGS